MPDLLAHVCIAYTVVRLLSWRIEWLTHRYVTVALVGAFVPDLRKAELLVRDDWIGGLLGMPFEWGALHTLGGVVVSILVGVTLVEAGKRRRVFALLGLGAATHLVADAMLLTPSGRTNAVLWPLTRYHPPTPGLYLSTQPFPTFVATLIAGVVWLVTRLRKRTRP